MASPARADGTHLPRKMKRDFTYCSGFEVGLEWNCHESPPCNLLIARLLSVDYTLLRASISEKRPSSVTVARPVGTHRVQRQWTNACVWYLLVLVRCPGSCTQESALVTQARMPADVSCAHSSGAVGCWDMHAVIRAARCCALIDRYRSARPLPVVSEPCAGASARTSGKVKLV